LDFWRERKSFLFLRTTTTLLLLNTWTALFLSTLFIRGGLNLVFHSWGVGSIEHVFFIEKFVDKFQPLFYFLKSYPIGKR